MVGLRGVNCRLVNVSAAMQEVRAEMRQVAWEITDKEGVAKASDRSHEHTVQEIHAKEEAVEDRRRLVQRATEKADEVSSHTPTAPRDQQAQTTAAPLTSTSPSHPLWRRSWIPCSS